MKKLVYSIAIALSVASCSSVTTTPKKEVVVAEVAQTQGSEKLQKLLDDIWQYELSISPGMAKSRGQNPTRALPDISLSALDS